MPPPARVIACCVGELLVSLLRLSAESLRSSAVEQMLVQKLEQQFSFSMGHKASTGEVRSWSASLPVLAQGGTVRVSAQDGRFIDQ